jgi:hypothetical protein
MFTGIGVLAGSLAELFHLDETPLHAELAALRVELQAVERRLGDLAERAREERAGW